jgi:hypothetical protein
VTLLDRVAEAAKKLEQVESERAQVREELREAILAAHNEGIPWPRSGAPRDSAGSACGSSSSVDRRGFGRQICSLEDVRLDGCSVLELKSESEGHSVPPFR